MKQSWTVDKYDVPSGDLEFWATRRGILPEPANQNLRGVRRGPGVARRVAVAVCLAVLTGFALHGLAQSEKTALDSQPPAAGVSPTVSR